MLPSGTTVGSFSSSDGLEEGFPSGERPVCGCTRVAHLTRGRRGAPKPVWGQSVSHSTQQPRPAGTQLEDEGRSFGLEQGGCAPLPRAGAAFSLPFLNFDFSRCEKWDCNISPGRARFGADRGGFVQCSRASWASARGLSCLPEDAFAGLLHSHVKFSCKDVGTGRGLFCLQ